MNKVVLSVAFLGLVLVGGYFADDGYKAKVDSALGLNKAQVAIAQGAPATTTVVRTQPEAPAAVASVAPAGDTLASMMARGTVVASVQSPAKPFYSNEGGRAKGFNIDFMNLMFAQDEFKGRINTIQAAEVDSYSAVPEQLLDGKKVDIAIDGLTFNDQDLNGVVYTIPYVKDFGYSLITARGNIINSAADLDGAKIGIIAGDPDVRALVESAFPGAKIVEVSERVDSNGKWMPAHFRSGAVDAIVYDYPFAVAELEGTDLQFSMPKIKGSDIQYRIGVRKGDKELLATLNSAIRKATETEQYGEMLKRYFVSSNVAAVRRASSGEVTHVVVKGDTLSTIAQTMLGDKMRYGDIQLRNNLANPNFIAVGQRLVIPK